ncbi:predicted protein [Methanosarcina acetivorans C2A]|uniref:Uncharacterized protein n=1 Tax=Methanosarcina acetivorans (strain ATCC 35395 / DSM 2834 / JCM 12185 / C2A) TaxID=188937 RepID=Q8TUJ4_METAC|nr:predicted protein [Methanosarcina acetivorans C2A]
MLQDIFLICCTSGNVQLYRRLFLPCLRPSDLWYSFFTCFLHAFYMFRFLSLHSCFISIVGRVSVPAQSASQQQNKPPHGYHSLANPIYSIIIFPDSSATSEQGMWFPKTAPLDIIFHSTE